MTAMQVEKTGLAICAMSAKGFDWQRNVADKDFIGTMRKLKEQLDSGEVKAVYIRTREEGGDAGCSGMLPRTHHSEGAE